MISFRSLAFSLLSFGVGAGAALFLVQACGQAGPVTVRLDGTGTAGQIIRVYVYGAVRSPGVYSLQSGDRVVDAVEAAGGPSDDAATDALNFAQKVSDEGEVRVPRLGEVASPGPSSAAGSPATRVDINRADANLLRTLPGIGATRATNIVNSRQQNGPFRSTDDLVQRKLVTAAIYAQIKNLIVVTP